MAKFTIVFHSVCGNTLSDRGLFYRALQERGQEVALYRTADASFRVREKRIEDFKCLQDAIEAVPVIEGSGAGSAMCCFSVPPTWLADTFPAQMKAFMDSFENWVGSAYGREVFSGASHQRETDMAGRSFCLQVMSHLCPKHMGMVPISFRAISKSGSAGVWESNTVRRDGGPGRDGRDKNGGAKLWTTF